MFDTLSNVQETQSIDTGSSGSYILIKQYTNQTLGFIAFVTRARLRQKFGPDIFTKFGPDWPTTTTTALRARLGDPLLNTLIFISDGRIRPINNSVRKIGLPSQINKHKVTA